MVIAAVEQVWQDKGPQPAIMMLLDIDGKE
jgi:hypothetical protein